MANQPTEAQWADLRAKEAALLATVSIPVTPHDIEIAGERFHYVEAGDPRLPPLVMVHGRGSAAALWFPIMAQLAPHRHLIAIDMRGWGLASRAPFTGHSGAEAIAWWRDGVLAVVDALGIDRFDLIGHSLGGLVVLGIALARGTRIDHLLLEDAAGFATTSPFDIRLYFALGPERVARRLPRGLVIRLSRASTPIPDLAPAARAALGDFVYTLTVLPGTQESGVRAFNAIVGLGGVRYTLRDQVHTIPTLTRALWGTKDSVVPLATSKAGIEMMPQAEIVTFAGAQHSPHMEMPAPFAQSVLDFLARGSETPVSLGIMGA